MADSRARVWRFVFYPESAPENWDDVISDWLVVCYVSPLHDKDVKDDGTLDKPHYHGVLVFEGPKSYGQVLEMVKDLGCSTVKPANSLSGSIRYLCHMDHPKKYQYDLSDIKIYGHADLSPIYEKTRSESKDSLIYLINIIRREGFLEFSEVVDWVMQYEPSLFDTLLQYDTFIKNYVTSSRFGLQSVADKFVS